MLATASPQKEVLRSYAFSWSAQSVLAQAGRVQTRKRWPTILLQGRANKGWLPGLPEEVQLARSVALYNLCVKATVIATPTQPCPSPAYSNRRTNPNMSTQPETAETAGTAGTAAPTQYTREQAMTCQSTTATGNGTQDSQPSGTAYVPTAQPTLTLSGLTNTNTFASSKTEECKHCVVDCCLVSVACCDYGCSCSCCCE